ncbi:MAG TPA: 50S ribosome-binding protein YggL [Planctomycetaceae bacterium]|nr:50S ribosome-binding protein YggL [Planctomycetaceae bacterium]
MRKRLRKKKHLGEFQEFGVELSVVLRPQTDFDSFLDDFLEHAVEANGLGFGGGGKAPELSGILELGRRDVFRANLALVQRWLAAHDNVESFRAGEPVDAWHSA